MTKFALISFGNEESYGLLFVGEELKKHGKIKYFDAEMGCVGDIITYNPDYICFSPMTTFYDKAKMMESYIKQFTNAVSIFGGHHATNCGYECGDITVVGSIHGLDISRRGIVQGGPTDPSLLISPSRKEYFRDIPRMKNRYRKVMLSVTGCPWTCSYCSSSCLVTRKLYGSVKQSLTHRNIEDIIKEAKFIKSNTHEIEWVDDDVFYGDQDWLKEFYTRWNDEIEIPMYVSATSISALKVKPELLKLMRKSVNCIGLGVQASRPESLKILGRSWDNMEKVKKAYDYLTSFGFNVNLQCIIGLPVLDPVGDALETISVLKDIGPGSVISCYPLQVYPNTSIGVYAEQMGFKLNEKCTGDTNSGLPAIDFGTETIIG